MAVKFISKSQELIQSDLYELASIKDVTDWLEDKSQFCVDTETTNFFDFEAVVIMLQIGDEETQFVIDTRGFSSNELQPLWKYFESEEILKLFHNAKFDVNMLRFTYGVRTENVYDTFLGECCLTTGIKGRSLGLEYVVSKYCGHNLISKEERSSFTQQKSKPYTASQILYGANDIAYLQCIMNKQVIEADSQELLGIFNLENKAVLAIADMEYNGILLDSEEWIELAKEAEVIAKKYQDEIDEMVYNDPKLVSHRPKFVQTNLFDIPERKVKINWNSPIQVKKVFSDIGLNIESTGEKEISKYQNSYPLVKKFIDFKKQEKLLSTYGLNVLDYINPKTGRVYTNIWQCLETHRISSRDMNLQQIPAKGTYFIYNKEGKKIKSIDDKKIAEKYAEDNGFTCELIAQYLHCFKAPKGYKLVNADYAGQELRIIAELSQDPLWIETFINGEDLHGTIAAKIFNIDIKQVKDKLEYVYVGDTKVYLRGKSPRDITKTLNFALGFGASEYKISDTLSITVEQAKEIIVEYFRVIPKVKEFLEKCARYGVKNGYMRSSKPFSIKRNFVVDYSDKKSVGEVERASKNTRIQATGATMVKLAMIKLRKEIKRVKYDVEFILQVHDSLLYYVQEDHAEEWAEIQKKVMIQAGKVFIKSIPVDVDVQISDYWSK